MDYMAQNHFDDPKCLASSFIIVLANHFLLTGNDMLDHNATEKNGSLKDAHRSKVRHGSPDGFRAF